MEAGVESEEQVEKLKQEFFDKMKAEDFKFVQENFPLGTEFVLLGVRFRVYEHVPPPHSAFGANYVDGKGRVQHQVFQAEEARTYIEGPNRLEIHNGRNL